MGTHQLLTVEPTGGIEEETEKSMNIAESSKKNELNFISFLGPLAEIETQKDKQKRTLKLLSFQVMEANQLATYDFKKGWLDLSHIQHIYMLAKCKLCLQAADLKTDFDIVCEETKRIMQIITHIEQCSETKLLTPRRRDGPEQNIEERQKQNTTDDNETVAAEKIEESEDETMKGDKFKFVKEITGLIQKPHTLMHYFLKDFDSIAGYSSVKQQLYSDFIKPRLFTIKEDGDKFEEKLCAETRLLLFGPPGTGKTSFVEGLAKELQINFLPVSQGDYASPFHGSNLHKIQTIFYVAMEVAPVLLFFDEVDSILPDRKSTRSEHKLDEVNQFLTLMDAVTRHNTMNPSRQVLLFGATNFPYRLDEAPRRRFENVLHVPAPDEISRREIMEYVIGKPICSVLSNVDWKTLMTFTRGCSCDNLIKLCKDVLATQDEMLKQATYFKPLFQNNIITHWTPCEESEPGAVKNSYKKFANNEILKPPLEAVHFVECAKMCTRSLDVDDPQGCVKLCEDFNEKHGKVLNSHTATGFTSKSQPERFDSANAYQEAKKIMKRDEMEELFDWIAPRVPVKPQISTRPLPEIPKNKNKEKKGNFVTNFFKF